MNARTMQCVLRGAVHCFMHGLYPKAALSIHEGCKCKVLSVGERCAKHERKQIVEKPVVIADGFTAGPTTLMTK
jgi:hypothetical protein